MQQPLQQPIFVRLPDGLLAPMLPTVIPSASRDFFAFPGSVFMDYYPARSGQIAYWDTEQQSFFTATYVNFYYDEALGVVEYVYDGEPVKGDCVKSRDFKLY